MLLARHPRHPPKVNTTLAGFVEVGETFESCVAREVFEEVGIHIDADSVQYITSQPWPYPQSSMIGFTAVADASQPLMLDEEEITSAGWFTREEVAKAIAVNAKTIDAAATAAVLEKDPSLTLLVPPIGTIARILIETWANNRKKSAV